MSIERVIDERRSLHEDARLVCTDGRYYSQRIWRDPLTGQRRWESLPMDPDDVWRMYPNEMPHSERSRQRQAEVDAWVNRRWWRPLMRDLGRIY